MRWFLVGLSLLSALPAARAANVVQDVMVLYTVRAVAATTEPALQKSIIDAVAYTNKEYVASGAQITLRLVAMGPSPVQESGQGIAATVTAFKNSAAVKELRDDAGADFMILESRDAPDCGYAMLSFYWSTGSNGVTTYFNIDSHAVMNSGCLVQSKHTFDHEIGHLQGLVHNHENTQGNLPKYPWGYGYRVCAPDGFYDIMSFSCPGMTVPRLSRFSNPNLTYGPYATGITYVSDPTRASDSARALNDNAVFTAAFRDRSTPWVAPPAPTGLTVAPVAGRAVLTWTRSPGAVSVVVLRAKQNATTHAWGVATVVTTLGEAASTWSQAPGIGTWRYSLYAQNAGGVSATTAPVEVTL